MLQQHDQRHVLGRAVDAQAHVRRRAHLQADARRHHRVQQGRVLARAHAVPQAGRLQGLHDVAHVLGPQKLAAVGEGGQPRAPGDREGRSPRVRPTGALVVAQSEADDGARGVPRVPDRQPCEGARVQRMAHPGGRHDDRDLHPRQNRRLSRRIQDDFQGGRDTADVRGVGGRIHLDLQAPRPLRGVVQGRLQHDPPHRLLGGHQVAGRIVGSLEAEPAAVVGRHVERVAVDKGRRQARARSLSQVHQRFQTHRPREVQMQVRLGQGGQVAHGRIVPRSAGSPIPSARPDGVRSPGASRMLVGCVPVARPSSADEPVR